jgi:hypothetical protein
MNAVLQIRNIIEEHGRLLEKNKYIMNDAILNEMNNGFQITTAHLDIIYKDCKIEFKMGNNNLMYKLLNRLKISGGKIKKKREDYLNQNNIVLNGLIISEDNGPSYDHVEWGDLYDNDYKISLSDLLLMNTERKAKIIIQFEN